MAGRDIIVIGSSSDGLEALIQVVRGLPKSLPASIFVAAHVPPSGSRLPEILSGAGRLLAEHARNEPFHRGHIYVAPPDRHLVLLPDEQMAVTHQARENHFRPAIDPLFRSAARHYGPRVVGVILAGGMNDGTAGLMAVRAAGGTAIIQEPGESLINEMTRSALQLAGADQVLPAAKIATVLAGLVIMPANTPEPAPGDPVDEIERTAKRDALEQLNGKRIGSLSTFTCPDCGGSLWQTGNQVVPQFRCHVGHLYTAETLLAEQSEELEAALWTSVRTFREKSVLAKQLAETERKRGRSDVAERYDEQARTANQYAELILEHVLHTSLDPLF